MIVSITDCTARAYFRAAVTLPPDRSQICRWLRQSRDGAGLSRRAVSDAINVTERAIQSWEDPDDSPLPPADKFLALVMLYNADVYSILPRQKGAGLSEAERRQFEEELEANHQRRHQPGTKHRRTGGAGR